MLQPILYHEVIGKRQAAIDQFCNGLNVLGLLQCIRANPGLFEHFFVYNEKWTNIIGFFEFDETVDTKLIEYHLTQFLEDSPISIKKKLIFYVSGSFSLPAFKKIRVRSGKVMLSLEVPVFWNWSYLKMSIHWSSCVPCTAKSKILTENNILCVRMIFFFQESCSCFKNLNLVSRTQVFPTDCLECCS